MKNRNRRKIRLMIKLTKWILEQIGGFGSHHIFLARQALKLRATSVQAGHHMIIWASIGSSAVWLDAGGNSEIAPGAACLEL
jgi:hypothetical protein